MKVEGHRDMMAKERITVGNNSYKVKTFNILALYWKVKIIFWST